MQSIKHTKPMNPTQNLSSIANNMKEKDIGMKTIYQGDKESWQK
jgi:hypothetical protein